jgi:hypothetical protein
MTVAQSNPVLPLLPHLAWMYAAATRRVRDPHLADDIVQAVLILYWRKGSVRRLRAVDTAELILYCNTVFAREKSPPKP